MIDGRIFLGGVGGALTRGFCGGVSASAGRSSDSAVIDSRYKHARQRVLVSWEGSSSSHDPSFSREAASLLDGIAPCHESQNPAARRPWQTIALMRGLLWERDGVVAVGAVLGQAGG